MNISKRALSNFLLVLTAFIWGTAFIAQKEGLGTLKPCTFNGIRTMMGCIALLPVIAFREVRAKKNGEVKKENTKMLVIGGIVCGVLLCAAGTSQTFGLVYADAGKAGFITALYIVLVPVIGIFIGKKVKPIIIASVVIALFGLYFLCVQGTNGFSLNNGDRLLFLCALLFSFHILSIDYFSPKVDGVKLSCIQFFVSASINIAFMLIIEKPEISEIINCWFPLFYAGVMSCGVAYTLQIVAQKNTDPSVASIIMSLESLFALLAGIVFGENPSARELFGCFLMLLAIMLVQLPDKKGDTI